MEDRNEDFFDKIFHARKFAEENRSARRNAPLLIVILNDCIPLFTAIAYILIGFLANVWHPTWLIFFVIPLYYMTVECIKHKNPDLFPVPIIVAAAYLAVGFLGGIWHPTWAIFVIVPLYYGTVHIVRNKDIGGLIDILVPFVTAAAFLVIGFAAHAWHPGWLVFLFIPLYYQIKASVTKYKKRKAVNDADSDYIDTQNKQ
jgi:hypothetical protein